MAATIKTRLPLDETHDPQRRSWVESANGHPEFPIQNLPFGIFRRGDEVPRGGVAIGDMIVDIKALLPWLDGEAALVAQAAAQPTLNDLMAVTASARRAFRRQLSGLLSVDGPASPDTRRAIAAGLVPMGEAALQLPAEINAFTDMMVSSFHITGGRRGTDTHEPPGQFKHIPLGYNSRASSVVVSGTPVIRPFGVHFGPDGSPVYAPEPQQDFELEVGCFLSRGNDLGTRIPIADASEHIFGYCLLNDWSARCIQFFEMTPLGPFLGKSLATTISPWVVTAEALAPFAHATFARPAGDPAPLPHLHDQQDEECGGFDLRLEAFLATPALAQCNHDPALICSTNFKYMYWSFAQIIAHHSSNGCNLRPADLIGSGTTSGPGDDACGCLWELTARGTVPFSLPNGEQRLFLEDGDEVIFRARAEREGFVAIGFGTCRGVILPAHDAVAGQ